MPHPHLPHLHKIPQQIPPLHLQPLSRKPPLQLLQKHQRQKAHEDVPGDRRPVLVEDGPRRERLVTKPSLGELFAGVEGKEDRDARVYRAVASTGRWWCPGIG